MGSIISAINDDINHYYYLCEKYNEKPQMIEIKGWPEPDCYGKHATELKDRLRDEIVQEHLSKIRLNTEKE